jgi:hypothetical protein
MVVEADAVEAKLCEVRRNRLRGGLVRRVKKCPSRMVTNPSAPAGFGLNAEKSAAFFEASSPGSTNGNRSAVPAADTSPQLNAHTTAPVTP